MTKHIAVLTPPARSKTIPSPNKRPIAKVAQTLQQEGIVPIFGHKLYRKKNRLVIDGLIVENNQWKQKNEQEIFAIHDRYPSQIRWKSYQQMMQNK